VNETIDGDDDTMVLPWWYSWWRVALITVAATLALVAIGYSVRPKEPTLRLDGVDIGFLQDMRIHHGQAISMAHTFRELEGTDPNLRLIALEIINNQAFEVGLMTQTMVDFGAPLSTESETAMGWMGAPVPPERMPGMATDENLEQLAAASGADADSIFARLMAAHHEGGAAMADYAATHAKRAKIRDAAAAIARGQRGEIEELSRFS
jgi:uncharacterized protein (DUF305 family)